MTRRGVPEVGTVRVHDEDRPARRYPNGDIEYERMNGRWFLLADPAVVFTPKRVAS